MKEYRAGRELNQWKTVTGTTTSVQKFESTGTVLLLQCPHYVTQQPPTKHLLCSRGPLSEGLCYMLPHKRFVKRLQGHFGSSKLKPIVSYINTF